VGTFDLLEREQELARVAELVDAVAAGDPRLASVEGPPGAGKSAILAALASRAGKQGIRVLRATGLELEAEYPFGVVRQLLEPATSGLGTADRRQVFAGSAALAESLLTGGGRGTELADPGFALLHSLYWVLVGLSDLSPVAVVLDDAQWADSLSLRFLAFALRRAEALPLLVALAKRDQPAGEQRQEVTAVLAGPAVVMRPAPLSGAAISRLLTHALGSAPPQGVVQEAERLTEGNPLYLRELVEALRPGDSPAGEDAVRLLSTAAPRAVGRRVTTTLAHLDPASRNVGQAVAILGESVPLRRAASLAGVAQEHASAAADVLARDQILGVGEPLRFRHPLIRQAVLDSIEPRRRAMMHARAARLLTHEGQPPELAAVHLLESDPAGDATVVETLRAAAKRARNDSAIPLAISALRRALNEPPEPCARPVVLQELALVEAQVGDPLGLEHFEQAFATTASPDQLADGVVRYAMLLIARGRAAEAEAVVDRVLEATGDREKRLMLEADLTTISTINDVPGARERLTRVARELSGATAAERVLLGLYAIDLVHREEMNASEADRLVSAALGEGFLLEHLGPDSPTYLQLMSALVWLEAEEADRELAAAAVEARRRGAWFGFALVSTSLGYQASKRGQLDQAEADARAAVEVAQQMGWLAAFPVPLPCLVDVLIEKGEFEEPDRLLEELNLGGTLPQSHIFTDLLGVRGRLRLAQGRAQDGIDDLEEQTARLQALGDVPPTLLALHARSLVPELVRTGQAERAVLVAEDALGVAQAFGRPRYIAATLYASALAQPGGVDLARLEEAAKIYQELGAPVDLARSLLEIGSTLRRRRQPAAARDPLRRALDLARACGARPLALRAEHELRTAGAKPRRDRITGRDALTATEQRVAQLAINGMTNRQIAETLFVTRKTVESHLEHIFRKLSIHSRGELEHAIAAEDELRSVT
jgi:DNA-binding CsgD family transcriptional regulator